jgi:hypothetical protein
MLKVSDHRATCSIRKQEVLVMKTGLRRDDEV